MTAPARFRRATTVASFVGTWLRWIVMPAAVATPSVLHRSLTATGTPCSGPREVPEAVSASRRAASASARSAVSVAKLRSLRSILAMRSSIDRVSSTDESSRAFRRRATSSSDR